MCIAVLPSIENWSLSHGALVDHVHAPEGEEDVDLDTFAEGTVGHDQGRVGHVEVALRADERDLAIFGVVPEVGDDGWGFFGGGHVMLLWRSGALVRIGDRYTQPAGLGSPAT